MKVRYLLLSYCLFLFPLGLFCQHEADYPKGESEKSNQFNALKWLYEVIENENKEEIFSNWNLYNNPDSIITNEWKFITVDSAGYVTSLNLSGQELSATFMGDLFPKKAAFSMVFLPRMEELDLSGNNFRETIFSLVYAENPYDPQGKVHSLPHLKILKINNNNFNGILSIPENLSSLERIEASHNRFFYFSFQQSPWIKYIDLSHNELGGNKHIILWNNDQPFLLDTFNLSYNNITYADIFSYVVPSDEYHNFFEQPELNFYFYPQRNISLAKIMVNNTVRSVRGNTVEIKLPDVGQYSEEYPMLRDSLEFQWYKNGKELNNRKGIKAEGPVLRTSNFNERDTGTYYCKVNYTGKMLNELELTTDTFRIINQPNENPALTLREGDTKYQRMLKGSSSRPVRFNVSDDMPLDHPLARENNTFEVIKYPTNLEYLGDIWDISVKDTSQLWIGQDTLIVRYCDFEGGCTQDTLFFEVYDYLYNPPILSATVDINREFYVTWDVDFYDTKVEKPDGYILEIDTCPHPLGMDNYTEYIKMDIQGQTTSSASFTLPDKHSDYLLYVKLFAQKDSVLSTLTSSKMSIPIPVKSDKIDGHSVDSNSVTLNWIFNGSEEAYGMTNYNTLYYYSEEDGSQLLANTTYNDDSYIHNIDTENKLMQYKLVKRTLSLSAPSFSIELPYLEHIYEIDTRIVTDTLLAPPFVSFNSESTEQLTIEWDTGIYEEDALPEGYYLFFKKCPLKSSEACEKDSIYIGVGETNSYTIDLPPMEQEYLLTLNLYSYDGISLSPGFSKISFPMPVNPDTIISAIYSNETVSIEWKYSSILNSKISTNYSTLYYSRDKQNYDSITIVEKGTNSYEHNNVILNEGDSIWYKLVKRIVALDKTFEFEYNTLTSDIVHVTKSISEPGILNPPPYSGTGNIFDENQKATHLIIFWNNNFYESQVEKPTGYHFTVDTCNHSEETWGQYHYKNIESHINYNSFELPNSESVFDLKIYLVAYNDSLISLPQTMKYTIPVVPDLLLTAEVNENNNILLKWEYTTPEANKLVDYNTLYWSKNGGEFEKLTLTEPSDNSYEHIYENNLGEDILRYKLVKRAVSTTTPIFEIELPHLESNTVEVAKSNTSIGLNTHDNIKIYPNPSMGLITVEANDIEIYLINISDISGKPIYDKINPEIIYNKFSIDVTDLSTGVYIMELKTSEGYKSYKFIKQ